MKAMILAAGFGTRLKPLTDTMPKALIPFKSRPLITHQIERLKSTGIDEIVVNVHHHIDKMMEFFDQNDFGIKIDLIIEESKILGTGGGILNAKDFLSAEPFVVINVDISTDFNLNELIDSFNKEQPFAAIAVQKRNTKRGLVLDKDMRMTGIQNEESDPDNVYAFNCMHVISNDIFNQGIDVKFCGIFDIYKEMIKKGKIISGYDTGECYFKDLGKIENLN